MRKRSPVLLLALLALALGTIIPLRTAAQAKAAQRPAPAAQPSVPAPAQSPIPAGVTVKRLILKDGSFQPIVKFEMHGDRVRYLSAERYEWEDIPTSLIDWAATERYAREGEKHEVSAEARALDAEEEAERKREEDLTPQVAPGLRLPMNGGVFLLDVYNKNAELVELAQNGGELKRNLGRNVLRATINPLASQKQSIELVGAHARIQSHVDNPFLYVYIDEPQDESAGAQAQNAQAKTPKPQDLKGRFRIVRVETPAKKDTRIVGNIKISIVGKQSTEQKFIPTQAEAFSGPWVKVQPTEPLEPGEYALVEMLPDGQMNFYVWDFGVDPKAPENPGVWRPAPTKPNAESRQTPVLQKEHP